MMKKEKWKVSKTLPQFEVSSEGNLRYSKNRALKPTYDNHKTGYIYVQFADKGRCRSKKLHRLVAEMFCPNPENKATVNHKNGVKRDNRADNLEWMTHQENMTHAYENNLIPALKGEANGRAKLTTEEVHQICKLYQEGYHYFDIMETFSITKNQAEKIYRNTSWKHISTQYKF